MMEKMHLDMKADINTTNQICEKSFEEHVRSIDLHDIALKNIEVQLGQLMQAEQARNNTTLQGDKGSS